MNESMALSRPLTPRRELAPLTARGEAQPRAVPLDATSTAVEHGEEQMGARELGDCGAPQQGLPAQPLPPDNELWEVGDVARFLKRSVSWVYKKSSAGVLPVHRLDGWGLRFVPSELRSWAEGQRRGKGRR